MLEVFNFKKTQWILSTGKMPQNYKLNEIGLLAINYNN